MNRNLQVKTLLMEDETIWHKITMFNVTVYYRIMNHLTCSHEGFTFLNIKSISMVSFVCFLVLLMRSPRLETEKSLINSPFLKAVKV